MADTADIVLSRHRLSVEDYHRMGDAGVLTEDDRVELVEGQIVDMTPIGTPHAGTVDLLSVRFIKALAERAITRVQNPVVLSDRTEVQPDVALLRWRQDFYRSRHPRPEDVLLIVEVADTSIRYDREIKLPLYARAGVPEVWIVDLAAGVLTVCREPQADGYQRVNDVRSPSAQDVGAIPGVAVDLSDLFA